MSSFWKAFGRIALKVGIYALGHQAIVTQTIADAKSKNVVAILGDAGAIASGVAQ